MGSKSLDNHTPAVRSEELLIEHLSQGSFSSLWFQDLALSVACNMCFELTPIGERLLTVSACRYCIHSFVGWCELSPISLVDLMCSLKMYT